MKNDSLRIFTLGTIIVVLLVIAISVAYIYEPSFKEERITLIDSGKNHDTDVSADEEVAESPGVNPEGEIFINKILNSGFAINTTENYQFKNGIYYFQHGPCEGECVPLEQYPNSNYAVVIDKNKIALGQLDQNGGEDAALIYGERYGGTGYFVSLAIFRDDNGRPDFVTSKSLGDRTIVSSIKIENGLITLALLTHDSGEPMCCPNTKKTVVYELVEGTLLQRE